MRETKKVAWCWRRRIVANRQDFWVERLAAACFSWAITERPERSRLLLEVYVETRASATALRRRWGGRVHPLNAQKWLRAPSAASTQIGSEFKIIHRDDRRRGKSDRSCLLLPHGVAFGSGDHGTTHLLLRALIREKDSWSKTNPRGATVLDLGTGSGVLALAARLFGARKITAIDFDPDAIRTARQNETLNFAEPLIRWRLADVMKLRLRARYHFVLANLFSGILTDAAGKIADRMLPGGQLWLSGILTSQREEVVAAYRAQGLQLIRTSHRGKWVMLLLRRKNRVRKPAVAAQKMRPKRGSRFPPAQR